MNSALKNTSAYTAQWAADKALAKVELAWGVYVHVPWCRRRCVYCDFVLSVGKPDERFVQGVLDEARLRLDEVPAYAAQSLYFGGGTPTHLGAPALVELIAGLRALYSFADDFECTVEANPEDLTPQMCRALKAAGVNRLSIGLQSFNDEVLRTLGRKHRGEEALAAVQRAADFASVSCDLIIGVPQSPAMRLENDLEKLLDLEVTHVSTYMLTVEPETKLHELVQLKKRADVDEDHQADEYEQVQRTLNAAGFQQYEISSFAKPGHASRHNRLYWGQGTWIGLGPGAHSLTHLSGRHLRKSHGDDAQYWLKHPLPTEEERLTAAAAMVESLAFGLRDLLGGVSIAQLQARYEMQLPAKVEAQLQHEISVGNMCFSDGRFYIKPAGVLFADGIARRLLACS